MKHVFMNKENGKIASVLAMYLDDEGHIQTDSYDKVEDLLADYAALERAPKEPLIKDEKIRKAVRAWAEAVGTECVEITHSRSHFIRFMSYLADEDELCMSREIGQIFDEKFYTIDELCGEEE